jgi:hypothetical protein
LKLVQYNRTGFVKYEITDLSLKITTIDLFRKNIREIFLGDILIDINDKEKTNDSFNFTLGYISFAFFLFFGEQILFAVNKYGYLLAITGGSSLFFFLLWIFPAKEIQIGVENARMIRLFEKRPSQKAVNKFIAYLGKKIRESGFQ